MHLSIFGKFNCEEMRLVLSIVMQEEVLRIRIDKVIDKPRNEATHTCYFQIDQTTL